MDKKSSPRCGGDFPPLCRGSREQGWDPSFRRYPGGLSDRGPGGGLPPSSRQIYLDLTSSFPEEMKAASALMEPTGAKFVDGAIMGALPSPAIRF